MLIPRPPLTVMERFADAILIARTAVSEALRTKGLPLAIAVLIDLYLQRAAKRFVRLVEMARAGTLKPPRPRKAQPEGAEPPRRKPRETPAIRMYGALWIVRRAQGAAVAGSRLRALLDDPGMQEIVGLHPRIAAAIRPLLAAFGTAPNPGQLPPLPPRPTREKPPKPPRQPRARKVTWKCAKPPNYGLEFSDPTLNLWYGK